MNVAPRKPEKNPAPKKPKRTREQIREEAILRQLDGDGIPWPPYFTPGRAPFGTRRRGV